MARGVLSGSGLRYPVFAGAIAGLARAGVDFAEGICGTSGGAIVAAAYASRVNISLPKPDRGIAVADALVDVIDGINPGALIKSNLFPFGWMGWLWDAQGLYNTDGILKALREHLPARLGDVSVPLIIVTFDFAANQHVCWTNMSNGDEKGLRFAPNADLPLLVLASMSIPIVFTPVCLGRDGREGGRAGGPAYSWHGDGGLAANFPLDVWGRGDVLGLRFQPQQPLRDMRKAGKVELAMATLDGLIEAATREHLEDATYARTVNLKTAGSGLDFDLTPAKVGVLLREGEQSVSAWLERFRGGPWTK